MGKGFDMDRKNKPRQIKTICPRCERKISADRLYCVECERELGLVEESGKKRFSERRMAKIFMMVLVLGLGVGGIYYKFGGNFGGDSRDSILEPSGDGGRSVKGKDGDSSGQKMIVGTVYDAYLSSMKNEDMYSSAQYAILDIDKDGTEELVVYKEGDANLFVYTYRAGKVTRILNCPSAGLGHELELYYSDKYQALVSYSCTSDTREDVFYQIRENSFVYMFTLEWKEQRGDNTMRFYEYQDSTSFESLGSYIVSGKDYDKKTEEKNKEAVLAKYNQYMGDLRTIDFYLLDDYPDSQLPQEEKIESIRTVYYDIQDNLEKMEKKENGGITCYADETGIRKISAPKASYHDNTHPVIESYNAEYYYEDNKLIFVFVFRGEEEYRFYIEGDYCIRYIDEDGNIQNYEEKMRGEDISDIGYFCSLGVMELQEISYLS